MANSGVSLLSLAVGIAIAFIAGSAYARNRIARQDLIDTKNKIPGLRKKYWIHTMGRMIKWFTIVALILWLTINWAIHDQTDNGPTPLVNTTRSDGPKHPYIPKTFGDD